MTENVISTASCRLCANFLLDGDYTYVFAPENVGFSEKLNECLPITIKQSDTLPKQICIACLESFNHYHNFFFQVLNAEKKLKSVRTSTHVTETETVACVDCPLCTEGSMEVKDGQIVLGPKPVSDNRPGIVVLDNECVTKMIQKELQLVDVKLHLDGAAPESEVSYSCFACNEGFQCEMEVSQHNCSKTVQLAKPKSVVRSRRTARNIKADNDSHSVQCDKCGNCYESYKKLQYHYHNCHPQKSYDCNVCQESFPGRWKLTIHMRKHTGETPFKCKECGKEFRSLDSLKTHINVHHGNLTSLRCSHCQAIGFYNKQDLDNHIRTKHTKERKFKCNICGKSFMSSGVFYQHRFIHTDIRKYKCSHCARSFRRWQTLHNHIRRHTGEKPFKCDECGRKFRQRGDMKKHRVTQHSSRYKPQPAVAVEALSAN